MNPLFAQIEAWFLSVNAAIQKRRGLVLIVAGSLVVAAAAFAVFVYVERQSEAEVGREVNAISLEEARLLEVGLGSVAAQDRMMTLRKRLGELGEKHPNLRAGQRALYLAAHDDWRFGDLASARSKYARVAASSKAGLLAAPALYLESLTWEEEANAVKAEEALRSFERRFPAHWLLGEVRITLARVLMNQGKMNEAAALLDRVNADAATKAWAGRAAEFRRELNVLAQLRAMPAVPAPR